MGSVVRCAIGTAYSSDEYKIIPDQNKKGAVRIVDGLGSKSPIDGLSIEVNSLTLSQSEFGIEAAMTIYFLNRFPEDTFVRIPPEGEILVKADMVYGTENAQFMSILRGVFGLRDSYVHLEGLPAGQVSVGCEGGEILVIKKLLRPLDPMKPFDQLFKVKWTSKVVIEIPVRLYRMGRESIISSKAVLTVDVSDEPAK